MPPPPPVITWATGQTGKLRFSFYARANHAYWIEYCPGVPYGTWRTETNFPSQPTDRTIQYTNRFSSAPTYFRVRTQ